MSYHLLSGFNYILRVSGYSSSTAGSYSVGVRIGWPEATKPSILSRTDWNASATISSRLVPRTREPQRIIFHHSADKFSSTDLNDTIAEIQRIQNDHMNGEGKCDIAYHFIIDPAGRIWEGAEIDNYQRGHADGYFDDIGVLILGDFESRLLNTFKPNILNANQTTAIINLSMWLCYEYTLIVDNLGEDIAPISTHRTVDQDTVCPGSNAASYIENDLRQFILYWRS